MAFLDDHPNPYRNQQRERRDEPTGLFVVHTAESMLDVIGEDTGAEGVASFISNRSDAYGSYHRIADSDSVVPVVRFAMTAYGDGTGSNDIAIHISFACRTTDWVKMSPTRRKGFLRHGAEAVVEGMKWIKQVRGIDVPLRRISKSESDRRMPGFIGHGDRDPDRRTDPGHAFPWAEFFQTIDDLLGGDPMSDYAPQINDIQQTVKKVSEDLSEALSTLRKIHRQNGVVRSKVTRLIRQHRNDEPVTMDDLEGLLDLLAEEDDEEAEALDGGTP